MFSGQAVSTLGGSDGVTAARRRGTMHRHTPHTHAEDTRTVENTGSSDPSGANGGFPNIHAGTTLTTSSTDGGSGVSTDPLDGGAYLVLNYIIKT